MKKDDLSADQQVELATFVERLSAAGWDIENWGVLLDAGADVSPEAAATYSGPAFDLRLEYHASDRFLRFDMEEPDGDLALVLRMHPALGLPTLLARVIAIQDSLDADTMGDVVKSFLPLCDPLLIDTEDGLQRVTA